MQRQLQEAQAPARTADMTFSADSLSLRPARMADVDSLRSLIALSVRELQKDVYSPRQLAIALETVFTLDTQLIADETYFVIESKDATPVACGGWSRRKTLCGGDMHVERDNAVLNPSMDAAKIRAFFVHPEWTRRGLGSRLLVHCEEAAQKAGFSRFEMAATLTGVPLYIARGYSVVKNTAVPLCGSSTLPVVVMARSISDSRNEILSNTDLA